VRKSTNFHVEVNAYFFGMRVHRVYAFKLRTDKAMTAIDAMMEVTHALRRRRTWLYSEYVRRVTLI
jgi:hypothetical protein